MTHKIELTVSGPTNQINEARYKLDRWLSMASPPPPGQVQAIRLLKKEGRFLTYELDHHPRIADEPRMIL